MMVIMVPFGVWTQIVSIDIVIKVEQIAGGIMFRDEMGIKKLARQGRISTLLLLCITHQAEASSYQAIRNSIQNLEIGNEGAWKEFRCQPFRREKKEYGREPNPSSFPFHLVFQVKENATGEILFLWNLALGIDPLKFPFEQVSEVISSSKSLNIFLLLIIFLRIEQMDCMRGEIVGKRRTRIEFLRTRALIQSIVLRRKIGFPGWL